MATSPKAAPAKPAPAKSTGKVLPVTTAPATVPAATADKPKAAKRSADWRTALKTAGITLTDTSVLLFNDSTYNAKPKRGKSATRIAFYKRGPNGMTVLEHSAAYAEAKLPKSFAGQDRNWDYAHGFITVK